MGGILLRIKSWWDGADKGQRTVTVVGGGFLVFLVVVTYMFASKPHMGLLASGLSPAEQGIAAKDLQKMGIPYEMDQQGNLNVPTDRIAETRSNLEMAGHLPVSHGNADTDLSKLSAMTSPSVEREQLKANAEARLAQTIEGLDGIATASVHLALGDESPFASDKKGASASVTLHEKPGALITAGQARGIARMVASAVPNLELANVTVLNSQGEPLVDPDDQTSASSKVAMKLDTERKEAKRRERELQMKLDQVFGVGTTVVDVNVELDFKAEQYRKIERVPSKPLTTAETNETMSGDTTGTNGGGLAGAPANAGAAPTAAATTGSGKAYVSKQAEKQYLVNETDTTGEDPAGKLKKMSIGVMIDSERIKDKTKVEEFVASYLGPLAKDPANFTSSVTETKFDTTAADAAKKAIGAAGSRDMMQQALSILPIAALIIVAMMVLKSVTKFAQTQTLAFTTADGQVIPLPSNGLPMSHEAMAAYAEGHKKSGGHASSNLVLEGATPDEIQAALHGRSEHEEDDIEVAGIKKKVHIPLEQIKKMADERPEMVATLIKSWMVMDGQK